MKRREFSKTLGLSAVAVSTFGFIQCSGDKKYVGDCQTTTDILGPFYRPDSPVRNNLVIEGMPGEKIILNGIIRQKDCTTPIPNAKIELWHCSAEEVYDNESPEFNYRGTSFADAEGKYEFITQMPVPYDAGGGEIRPAHFHIRVSTEGYPDLITQLYFSGDPYVEKDFFSRTPEAQSRVLEIQEVSGTKSVAFDCNLSDHLKPNAQSLDKLVGTYITEDGETEIKLFSHEGDLWMANEVFGEVFDYTAANEFNYRNIPDGLYERLNFEINTDQIILTKTSNWGFGEQVNRYTKKS